MGEWSGLVVFAAGTSWDGNWFPDQHIASRLTRYAPVLYVDPPLSHLTALRKPELAASLHHPRLRTVEPALARLTPVVPPKTSASMLRPVAEAVTRAAIRRAVHALGGDVHAVVAAGLTPAFGLAGERRRVLYATDDFVAMAPLIGVSPAFTRRLEARQLASVDTVVSISEELAARYRERGVASVVIPNGCDEVLFAGTDAAPLPDDVRLPPPIAGFVGHLAERIDVALLEAVAERGHSLLLVGPRSDVFELRRLERLLGRANVQWVGPKSFRQLPSYLRVMDVGLVPYADSAFNRASFPLKTLEYLAAGRAAVATDLPAVRWLDTEHVIVARGALDFADAVGRALGEARTPALVAARRAFAARHGWDRRAAEFAEAIGLPVAVEA